MAKPLYTDEIKTEQLSDIILKDGSLAVGQSVITAPHGGALNQSYIDDLAFMEEQIEIVLQESADENAENPVMVCNNGNVFQFWRGQPTVAKRKFVDCLIVKQSRVTTPKVRTPNGDDAFAIRQQSALKYPFMVIQDRNPKGAEWLRRRIGESI